MGSKQRCLTSHSDPTATATATHTATAPHMATAATVAPWRHMVATALGMAMATPTPLHTARRTHLPLTLAMATATPTALPTAPPTVTDTPTALPTPLPTALHMAEDTDMATLMPMAVRHLSHWLSSNLAQQQIKK